jgi:hypothetical protein
MPVSAIEAATSPRRQQVVGAIADAARAAGVDFSYLLGQARLESGLNPTARARTSSATGLYQFIDQSWLAVVDRHGPQHGLDWASAAITRNARGRLTVSDPSARSAIMALRNDPVIASRMAAEHAADNRAYLEPRIGRTAQPVDLYLAHFLGAAGAARFLTAHASAPDSSAAALFPRAAAANRNVFYARDGRARSLAEVRDRFAERLANAGGAATAAPAGPAITDPATQQVQPADWLRLTRAAATSSDALGSAGSQRLSAGPGGGDDAMPALLSPQRARLAYMILAATGATL